LPPYPKEKLAQDKLITTLSAKMKLLKLIEFNKIEILERISAEGLSGTLAQQNTGGLSNIKHLGY
jgi:hypothetical protein